MATPSLPVTEQLPHRQTRDPALYHSLPGCHHEYSLHMLWDTPSGTVRRTGMCVREVGANPTLSRNREP